MAALPASNTARFKVKYTNNNLDHSMTIRSTPVSPSAFGVVVNDFLTALSVLLWTTTIVSVEFAASGSDVFNPVTSGIEGEVYGGGTVDIAESAWEMSFVGRTAGGRKSRLFFIGINGLGVNYRYAPGESASVDNAIAVLNGAPGVFLGIDGLAPVWKSYANAGVSDHWVKKLR